MSLDDLRDQRLLHPHAPTPGEIADLLLKAQQARHDADAGDVSLDHRFVMAYHGALAAATAVLAAAGYRAATTGHHETVFAALPLVMPDARDVAGYFDRCRRKRNQALYDRFGQVSVDELDELMTAVGEFIPAVKRWLSEHHPTLYPGALGG